jgi:hypothetical protein
MLHNHDASIVRAAEAAVDDWERGLKAHENGNTLAVHNIHRVQEAVNAKRAALKNEPLLAGLIRLIDDYQENSEISDEEGARYRRFLLDLFQEAQKGRS